MLAIKSIKRIEFIFSIPINFLFYIIITMIEISHWNIAYVNYE